MVNTTRENLVAEVMRLTGRPSPVVKDTLETLLKVLRLHFIAGSTVQLRGFGTFFRKARKATMAQNPRTGKWIPVPMHQNARFRPSPKLKRKLQ